MTVHKVHSPLALRRIAFSLVSVLLSLAFTVTAPAQRLSGNDILDVCEQPSNSATQSGVHNNGRTGEARLKPDLGFCYAYLSGVTDAVGTRNTSVFGKWAACLPAAGFRMDQERDVVIQYLHVHAADRHLNGALLVGAALAEAWPCP